MKIIVDVVNFNADASCLSSGSWLGALKGGEQSLLVRWLGLYLDRKKRVVLGFPGATVADIARHNPEAIQLINAHPEIFEIILRPFAHDISLLRLDRGFQVNLDLGFAAIRREFLNVRDCFLPPEFMLTNEQIVKLRERGVTGIFINPSRFSAELKGRIPAVPYLIRGLFGSTMPCVPFRGKLTNSYLHALQMYDCAPWNAGIAGLDDEVIFVWRDGESSFLLPDGLARETFWLANEDPDIKRLHLGGLELAFLPNEQLEGHYFRSYPVHSFSAWMKEFRMLGFIDRVRRIEERLEQLTDEQVVYWLMAISSDIMSSIEKRSPIVPMQPTPGTDAVFEHTILRSERGFEGEEYLAALEFLLGQGSLPDTMWHSDEAHLVKLQGRLAYARAAFAEPLAGTRR